MLEHLVIIDLKHCRRLRKLPKVLSCMETLEEFIIDYTHIAEIPNWGPMRRLRVFSCCQLTLPEISLVDKAKNFKLKGIETLLESLKDSASLIELDLSFTQIIELPDTIGRLKNLKVLKVCSTPIKTFPKSIKDLASLIELDLSGTEIIELPDTIGNLKNLKVLRVENTPIKKLPTAIGMLENLITLDAVGDHLHNIPKLPQSLISLEVKYGEFQNPDLSNLINLKNLKIYTSLSEKYAFKIEDPALWWIGRLNNLESLTLNLRECTSLHADLGKLSQLIKLGLYECTNLESIPKLPPGLKELVICNCNSLGSLLDLPSGLVTLRINNCMSLTLLDVSYLRKLGSLDIWGTSISKLKEIKHGMLENLNTLSILLCEKLQRLPDLSNLKKLRSLFVSNCPNLVEIPGTLESLDSFSIYDCKSLERIPDIPNSKTMGDFFRIKNCGKIKRSSV